jgi:integrase
MARKAEGWTLQRDKRTGNLIAQFRIAGKKYRRSTRTPDPIEAKGEAARIYGRALREREGNLRGDWDMAELLSAWLDDIVDDVSSGYLGTQAKRAVHVAERFPKLRDVTPGALRLWIKERRAEVLDTTIRRDLVPLRECLRWAFEEGLIDEPVIVPLPKKRKKNKGTRAHETRRVDLTDHQAEALIAALPVRTRGGHPARDVFTVAWDTTLRHGGVFRIEAGRHFRPPERMLYRTADIDKNGSEEELVLTDRAYQAILRNAPDIGPIFKPWDYRKTLRKAARAIGLPPDDVKGLDMRDFRHAALSDGARKSGHLTGLSHMAGHTDQRTTNRYIHPQTDDQRKVLNKRFPSNGTPNGTPSVEPEEDAC